MLSYSELEDGSDFNRTFGVVDTCTSSEGVEVGFKTMDFSDLAIASRICQKDKNCIEYSDNKQHDVYAPRTREAFYSPLFMNRWTLCSRGFAGGSVAPTNTGRLL